VTVAAIAIAASVAVSVAGSVISSQQAAEGAENAQATIQGGISRLNAFRQQLKASNADYKTWQHDTTQRLVQDANAPALESKAYKDAQRRLLTTQAATGSVRSGAAQYGMEQLAAGESDRQIQRRIAVDQLLAQQTGRGDALIARTYDSEASLLGGKADAQQGEANAKAAGTQGAAQGISSALSAGAGAYGSFGSAGAAAPAGGGAGAGSFGAGAYNIDQSYNFDEIARQKELYGTI